MPSIPIPISFTDLDRDTGETVEIFKATLPAEIILQVDIERWVRQELELMGMSPSHERVHDTAYEIRQERTQRIRAAQQAKSKPRRSAAPRTGPKDAVSGLAARGSDGGAFSALEGLPERARTELEPSAEMGVSMASQPQATDFDFDVEPPPPDYTIDGICERGHVDMLSGDTGSAKSILATGLVWAGLAREPWLGRQTHFERITIIDEENHGRLVRARLGAMGLTNDMRDRFRYFSRQGVAIGEDPTNAWLDAHLEEFKPDVVIVDTLMSAALITNVNDNSEATRRMKEMRQLATKHNCTFLVLHHERKPGEQAAGTQGMKMMGARQWAGQADNHMTIRVLSDLEETDAAGLGFRRTRREFAWTPHEKDREGSMNQAQRIAVTSMKSLDGGLKEMRVHNEGPIGKQTKEAETLAEEIVELLADGPMKRKDIAKALGKDSQTGTFTEALTYGVTHDIFAKSDTYGFYEAA